MLDDRIEKFYAARDPSRAAAQSAAALQRSKLAVFKELDCRLTSPLSPGPGRPPAGEPASLLFDPDYYRRKYPDVARTGHDPVSHFRLHGAAEGRRPNRYFDTSWYASAEGAGTGGSAINPFLHYVLYGYRQGLAPRPPGIAPDTES